MAKFSIFRGKDKQFYFSLKADNGEKILASEGYKSKYSALNGIESVKENASQANRYVRKGSKDLKSYFVLIAGNGEIVGTSEMYETDIGRENGIGRIMEIAPGAIVEDEAPGHKK